MTKRRRRYAAFVVFDLVVEPLISDLFKFAFCVIKQDKKDKKSKDKKKDKKEKKKKSKDKDGELEDAVGDISLGDDDEGAEHVDDDNAMGKCFISVQRGVCSAIIFTNPTRIRLFFINSPCRRSYQEIPL